MPDFDLLIGPIGCLVPCHQDRPRTGASMKQLPVIADGAVGAKDGVISFVGPWSEVKGASATRRIDATGRTVLPGFVDSHTHIPFLGDRASELVLRLGGATYMDIGKAGGGILSTMRAVRAASQDELLNSGRVHARRLLAHGVTTFEAKSGYGLDLENELKQLRAIKALSDEGPQRIAATCLSAHFVPPEFKGSPENYVGLICDEILPAVAKEKLARFCDVFCEEGAFTPEQSRRILLRGKELGLLPRIHADEIEDTSGAALAAEVGAVSADHLLAASGEGIKKMAAAGVCATLLPATAFYLRKPYAPARAFVEAGCPVAIASDCNPGSSYTANSIMVLTLAVFGMGLMPEEALWAMTLNAAYALRMDDKTGSLAPGKAADLCIWDVPSYLHLFYPFAENPLMAAVINGKVAYEPR